MRCRRERQGHESCSDGQSDQEVQKTPGSHAGIVARSVAVRKGGEYHDSISGACPPEDSSLGQMANFSLTSLKKNSVALLAHA